VPQADRDPVNRRGAVCAPQPLGVCEQPFGQPARHPAEVMRSIGVIATAAVRRRDRNDVEVVEHRPGGVQEPQVVVRACALGVRTITERGRELTQILDAQLAYPAPGLDQKPAQHSLGRARAHMLGEPKLAGGLLKAGQIALEPTARGKLDQARELAVHEVVVAWP
jgi:hypothetical protein